MKNPFKRKASMEDALVQYDKLARNLTGEQKNCDHDWVKPGCHSDYSICQKCRLMRHDKDGDLINPLVFG